MGPKRSAKFKRFYNTQIADRYKDKFQGRGLLLEKGFLLDNTSTMGQPPFVSEVIAKHNWKRFGMHPRDPISPLVKEFYTHLTQPEQTAVYVRGIDVPLTTQAINAVFGLPDTMDDVAEFIQEITDQQLEDALKSVTVEGTTWDVSPTGAYTCQRQALTPQARVWYHFLKHRIMPSTHGKSVTRNRIILLHLLIRGSPVNVGQFILDEIFVCAGKDSGGLLFPSLITELCINAEVPVEDVDERVLNKGAISGKAIARIAYGRPVKEPPIASSSAQPESSNAAASAPNISPDIVQSLQWLEQRMSLQEIQQYEMFDMLKTMNEQQRLYWEYAQQRDQALKKSMQRNFTRPMESFPVFPAALIGPWQPVDEPVSSPQPVAASTIGVDQPTTVLDEVEPAPVPQEDSPDAAASVPAPASTAKASSSKKQRKGKVVVSETSPRKMSLRSALNWKWGM